MRRDPDSVSVLRQYNAWRTGEDERSMDDAGIIPFEVTKAINAVMIEVENLRLVRERYEKLRMLNPRQFMALWNENIQTGVAFDTLVDMLKKGKA